ncbi:MAG TPA: hypothetical protein VEW46_09950 [Pyrinomonadaceae bacterium]|nr:hypothetical protein [Pyrinomonadaceae bacterium]
MIIGSNENVDIAVSKTSKGFSVAIVNHDSNKLEVVVKPIKSSAVPEREWVDLVTGDTIKSVSRDRSINLTIGGSGFRALEFRQGSAKAVVKSSRGQF